MIGPKVGLARAALLSKAFANQENPFASRILLIMPTLYRRWPSTKLRALYPRIGARRIGGTFAGSHSDTTYSKERPSPVLPLPPGHVLTTSPETWHTTLTRS